MKHTFIFKYAPSAIIYIFILCISSLKAQNFTRIESVAGLSILEENNGVSIADYNRDGYLDVFVVALGKDEDGIAKSHSRLFKNNNDGTFIDVTEASGLRIDLFPVNEQEGVFKNLEGVKYGAFWGDYDNDGFPDLFLTNIYKIYLFHNEGNGTFQDITTQAGFQKNSTCLNTGATWFDYNKDGFLDLYISDWNGCDSNKLYENNGDGTFSNVTNLFGTLENKQSFMSVPFDFNSDGWLDLYVVNDNATKKNDLFINQNGTSFIEQASTYGLDHAGDDMGIAIGDYNNDGFFDIHVTAINISPLFLNKGNNTFNNAAPELGVELTGWAWDTVFSDFDLDGDEDLFIVNGFDFGGNSTENNIYFENFHANGEPKFIDSSSKTNLEALTISMGAGIFDFDNDGDLDILVTNADRPSYLYENKTTDLALPDKDLHWFKVSLQGTTSNRDAIGTTLSITTDQKTLHRYYSGKGFLSQNLKPVHFGLGTATEIQELKITWYFRTG
ncbi:CRTAC1 family protein [Thalassobellus suaedae]|uniref:CRTAC1 family protein n=1 Tax=Thalassobellus suaedae TaxID=3074124 RepID=A0ABY9XR42_9FLAO|nr:CRTAC1 family protein [Flavobacteriaceae bacterium HL-DH14]